MLTNFDFLYDDEAEDVSWGPEYEDRRLSYGSMDVGSLDRDLKSNLQILECLSGSEQDLTPHDSSEDEDEVLPNIACKGNFEQDLIIFFLYLLIHCYFVSCQLARSLTTSTLTVVTDNSTVLESSCESSPNVTVIVIGSLDSDVKSHEQGRESRSPSVER